MDEAAASIPPKLLEKLKQENKFLTSGEIFGAANLWKFLCDDLNGNPYVIIDGLHDKLDKAFVDSIDPNKAG